MTAAGPRGHENKQAEDNDRCVRRPRVCIPGSRTGPLVCTCTCMHLHFEDDLLEGLADARRLRRQLRVADQLAVRAQSLPPHPSTESRMREDRRDTTRSCESGHLHLARGLLQLRHHLQRLRLAAGEQRLQQPAALGAQKLRQELAALLQRHGQHRFPLQSHWQRAWGEHQERHIMKATVQDTHNACAYLAW